MGLVSKPGERERGWRVESGEWRVESGEWEVESGEWEVGNEERKQAGFII